MILIRLWTVLNFTCDGNDRTLYVLKACCCFFFFHFRIETFKIWREFLIYSLDILILSKHNAIFMSGSYQNCDFTQMRIAENFFLLSQILFSSSDRWADVTTYSDVIRRLFFFIVFNFLFIFVCFSQCQVHNCWLHCH